MNEANITKSINIYPQVFYNAKENRPYFYLVVGDMKGNPIMFTDVIFYADGYQWAYETPNDTKEVIKSVVPTCTHSCRVLPLSKTESSWAL